MKNVRELVTRRIAIFESQIEANRKIGKRLDILEEQVAGWKQVLAMFDAGRIATTPRTLLIRDTELLGFHTGAGEAYVQKRLAEARFDLSQPFKMVRLPWGATRYEQEAMLP